MVGGLTARAGLAGRAETRRAGAGLVLRLRTREEVAPGAGRHAVAIKEETWEPRRTAAIVVDMWDAHTSVNAARRVGELAPVVDRALEALRRRGVLVIHAPSQCMDAYKEHLARRRATGARRPAGMPSGLDEWCRHLPSEDKGSYPIDQSDGGSDDDPSEREQWRKLIAAAGRNLERPWRAQHAAVAISDTDVISDSGSEIWAVLHDRRIDRVLLMGVHTNMCVLGRPFGLRQMVKNGKRAVLVRDLTDTMYNPARTPHVSHFTGTDLIVEHIEKFIAPTVESVDLVGGGRPFRFRDDRRPHVAFLIDEDEYKTESTLPAFALGRLGKHFRTTILHGRGPKEQTIPGMDLLDEADVVFVSVRRRCLPPAQLAALRRHVAAGKPVIGIRTASHAFALRQGEPPPGRSAWRAFDAEVLGGNYQDHHPAGPKVRISLAEGPAAHDILRGFDASKFASAGSLYRVSPIHPGARAILNGAIPDQASEPVAWTFVRADGGRSFYTSLGHPADFENTAFQRLLANAVFWAAGLDVPAAL